MDVRSQHMLETIQDVLQQLRYENPNSRAAKRRKVRAQPGKSVADEESDEEHNDVCTTANPGFSNHCASPHNSQPPDSPSPQSRNTSPSTASAQSNDSLLPSGISGLKIGDFVAVVYDDAWWLGTVQELSEEDVRIHFMHPHPQNCVPLAPKG